MCWIKVKLRVWGRGVHPKILDFLAFEICCSPTFLVSKMGSFVSQLNTVAEIQPLAWGVVWPFLTRLYRKSGSKNTQISHKWTKIWESTGPFAIKLGSLVHLMVLQKRYAGILKILIFWPVAPRGRFKNGEKTQIWTFRAAQPAKKSKFSKIPHNVFVGPSDEPNCQVWWQMAR